MDEESVMPWGKHKGVKIKNIPSGYLKWLAEGGSREFTVPDDICEAADIEYRVRDTMGSHFWES